MQLAGDDDFNDNITTPRTTTTTTMATATTKTKSRRRRLQCDLEEQSYPCRSLIVHTKQMRPCSLAARGLKYVRQASADAASKAR